MSAFFSILLLAQKSMALSDCTYVKNPRVFCPVNLMRTQFFFLFFFFLECPRIKSFKKGDAAVEEMDQDSGRKELIVSSEYSLTFQN